MRKREQLRAMRVADGVEAPRGDGLAAEADRFRQVSGLVREATALPREPVSFDAMWTGVENRLEAATVATAVPERPGFFERLLGLRPAFVLAPAGAFLVAAVLGAMLWLAPARQDNQCFVDSSEAGEGMVVVDQDDQDPERPTVIWYVEEG